MNTNPHSPESSGKHSQKSRAYYNSKGLIKIIRFHDSIFIFWPYSVQLSMDINCDKITEPCLQCPYVSMLTEKSVILSGNKKNVCSVYTCIRGTRKKQMIWTINVQSSVHAYFILLIFEGHGYMLEPTDKCGVLGVICELHHLAHLAGCQIITALPQRPTTIYTHLHTYRQLNISC